MKKNRFLYFKAFRTVVFLLISMTTITLQAQQMDIASVKVEEIKPVISFVKSSQKKTIVNYSFDQNRALNPYSVSYSFEIVKEDNFYSISAKSFLSELDLRFEEGVEMMTESDGVQYPHQLQIGQELKDATATYIMDLPANIQLSYAIEIKNRKVVDTETIVFDNQSYTAYLIESDLTLVKNVGDNNKISTAKENLKDWYVPALGNVKRERVTEITASNAKVERRRSTMRY